MDPNKALLIRAKVILLLSKHHSFFLLHYCMLQLVEVAHRLYQRP